jgi:hypothetical protein
MKPSPAASLSPPFFPPWTKNLPPSPLYREPLLHPYPWDPIAPPPLLPPHSPPAPGTRPAPDLHRLPCPRFSRRLLLPPLALGRPAAAPSSAAPPPPSCPHPGRGHAGSMAAEVGEPGAAVGADDYVAGLDVPMHERARGGRPARAPRPRRRPACQRASRWGRTRGGTGTRLPRFRRQGRALCAARIGPPGSGGWRCTPT